VSFYLRKAKEEMEMNQLYIKKLCSKGFLLVFALLYSFVAVVGSTYSWITSADTRVNKFAGEDRLETILVEVFEPDMDWKPGSSIAKEVSAYNNGTADMVVRLFFEEALKKPEGPVPFTAPGDSGIVLPEYCKISDREDAATLFGGGLVGVPSGLTVKARPLKTLVGGSNRYEYAAYYRLDDGRYQRVTASYEPRGNILAVSNIRYWGYTGYAAPVTAAWRETLPEAIDRLVADTGKMIAINYNSAAFDDTSPAAGKWCYNRGDGCFYYIGKLAPGEFTPSLLEGFTLGADTPVSYSAIRLNFTVYLESVSAAAPALGEWELEPGSDVYEALMHEIEGGA